MSEQTRKTKKNDYTHVLALLIFYENTKLLIYKVLCFVVYCTLDKYVCIDYMCLKK